ncbi:WD40 repeat domain-containing protein, partial [Streptomyces sp. NPDC091204]|uniref:WD40 repeat domain-containing protein n=1 Tax=Streptomyces sp. NPDC091204 TaxID=3155299 RepID=UPI003444143E
MRASGDAPRRYLIAAAVAHYPKNRAWDRPGLLEARDQVVRVFTDRLGYRLHDCLPLSPTRQQLKEALRGFCRSPERRADDLLTVYLSCHGEVLDDGGEHVLLTSDTDPEDLVDTALATAELTRTLLRDTLIRRVLLLLDACYVGQGGNQLAAAALERLGETWGRSSGSGLVVVSSAQPHQQAVAGLFPKLLESAVSDLPVAGHGPDTLPVNALVQHMNNSTDLPEHQRIGLAMVGLDGDVPPFFPNPRHDTRLNDIDLALQQAAAFDEQDRRRETEFISRLLVRAMGSHHRDDRDPGPPGTEWWFTGRHTALQDLAAWLTNPTEESACRVLTAGPGSGKTAVLGLVAALTHPERHRTVPTTAIGLPPALLTPDHVDAAIYAQHLTDTDVLDALGAAARVRAATVGELLKALDHRAQPLTVLIDALDEAATPDSLCTTILRPLIEHSRGRIRLLLGTRPNLLPRLGINPAEVINLDKPRYADPAALTVYAARTLLQADRFSPYRDHLHAVEPVAKAVAHAADRSFLIARITAGTLAATPTIPDPTDPAWQASLPRHAGDAMHHDLQQRLGPHAQRATDLLRPLAYAQGQGLPWEDIWAPLATAISGHPYSDDDLLWLRHAAGSYVVEATENGRSAYRLYHEAMAEYLRQDTDPQAVHAACAHVLTDKVPHRADGTRNWSRAHPYTLNHLAQHTHQAGLLDHLLTDSEYLVHATPRSLTPHLHHAHIDAARLNSAVYRTSLHLHHNVEPPARRQVLALDAARAGARTLHHELSRRILPGHWTPQWATGSTFNLALRDTLTGHTDAVRAVACTVLDGRTVAVTASQDRTVLVWDLATGRPVGEPITGLTNAEYAVACTILDGRTVAVTTTSDGTMWVWDLATGRPVGALTGLTDAVRAVASTILDGRSVAVAAGQDGMLRVRDLATGQSVNETVIGRPGSANAVACTVLDGRPVAVTTSQDGMLRVWDLATGQSVSQSRTRHSGTVYLMVCTVLDGRTVAVTASQNGTVRVWDLATGRPVGKTLTGHTDALRAVACTVLDGRTVTVTTSWMKTVRVWDLATGRPVGKTLTGHINVESAVACTILDGRSVAVAAGQDGMLRVWDLATGQSVNQTVIGRPGSANAVACTVLDGRPVAVTTGWDKTVRVWDLATGQSVGKPLTGHTDAVYAVACTVLDGRPVAVTTSQDKTVRVWVWDLATGQSVGKPLTGHTGAVYAVACTVLDGRPVAVTTGWDKTVRVWDLDTSPSLGKPLTGHTDAVNAVACTVLDGRPVTVTTSQDKTVRVWDLATGQSVGKPLTGHTDAVHAVACTVLDGRPVAVTTGWDKTVRVWDLATGQSVGKPLTGHTDAVYAVACTVLDGRPVAVTTGQNGKLWVWDLATGQSVGKPLTGHIEAVYA